MITPSTPIDVPAKTADGLWITNLIITAPSSTTPVRLQATIAPYISSTGEIIRSSTKTLVLEDVFSLAASDTDTATAIQALFGVIQKQVQAQGLF